MGFSVIIPARWGSTRLPGKMLADVAGLPLVVRVAHQARRSRAERVVVATDAMPIAEVASAHQLEVIMTDAAHPTGTDRLSECVAILGLAPDAIVVNVQGDEPLIDPEVINQVADSLVHDTEAAIATCAAPISDLQGLTNPNIVKVVRDQRAHALYFSRAAIPHMRNPSPTLMPLHHIGIYAYRVSFLRSFPTLARGALEQAESLEQLRALEHGFKIHVSVTDRPAAAGVDTADDLDRVRQTFREDARP